MITGPVNPSSSVLRANSEIPNLDPSMVTGKKATEAHKTLAAKKPHSGKKLTTPTLNKALAGQKLSNKAKKKVTRAVNAVLAKKGKGEAKVADLF